MLELGKDWKFPIDEELSKVWLTPKGVWGMSVRCKPVTVKVDGAFEESFAPRLIVDDLDFMGSHWQDLVGIEIAQEGAWHGEGEPSASLVVEQRGDLRESTVRVVGFQGTSFEVELDAECDVFLDDDHDKNVPLKVRALIPFEGVRFRFRAEGLDSRHPEEKAIQLLAMHLAPEGFETPKLEPLTEPGLYSAHFVPREHDKPISGEQAVEGAEDLDLTPEELVLVESANELLGAMVKQGWVEVEDGGVPKLAIGFMQQLEIPGRGSSRAARISDWFMDQDEVIEVHVADEELAPLLDKFW